MKKVFFYVSSILIVLASCKKDFTDHLLDSDNASPDNYTSTTKGQKFGALINMAHRYATDDYTETVYGVPDSIKIKLAQQYGVKYYRLAITHDSEWTDVSKKAAFLNSYRLFYDSGFSILLNVKYKNPGGSKIAFPDSALYRSFLAQVLDSLGSKKPASVYVENEETNMTYFNFTTLAGFEKYIPVLKGAVAECHSRSILITNGGLIMPALIPITWDWLKSRHPGDTALTNGFARKALGPNKATALINGGMNALINVFKPAVDDYAASGIDYINMHWYEPVILASWNDAVDGSSAGVDQTTVVPGVFDSVVSYLDAKFSVPILTNETGQLTSSDALTNSIMTRYLYYQALGSNFFPVVGWYDGDGQEQYTAYALHNAYKNLLNKYSYSLRSTGTAFKTKLQ